MATCCASGAVVALCAAPVLRDGVEAVATSLGAGEEKKLESSHTANTAITTPRPARIITLRLSSAPAFMAAAPLFLQQALSPGSSYLVIQREHPPAAPTWKPEAADS